MNMKKSFFLLLVALLCEEIYTVDTRAAHHIDTMYLEVVSLEDTLQRFYVIQRIDPFIYLLKTIRSNFWLFPTPFFDYDKVYYDGVLFVNEHMVALIDSLKKDQTIDAVFHMWGEIKRYKYLHDSELIKEFMQFVFIITRYSLKYQFPKNFNDEMQLKNIYLMNAIDSLTLDQMLDILDILIEDLPAFIKKYELDSTMTWKQWYEKYWLVAPLAIGGLLLKIYIDYRQLHKIA